MQQIINFVIKNKSFLLFLFLFAISFGLTIQSHAYHKSQFISSANTITGGIYSGADNIFSYFNLKYENDILAQENARLKEELYNLKPSNNYDSTKVAFSKKVFLIQHANVYKNSYTKTNNYITLNKGVNDSVKEDFGVITSKGILGIIDKTTNNYSRVLSILSKQSRVNAKLKTTNHFGSLIWNAESPLYVQLIDISTFSEVKIGDTIVTGGQSTIFPKNIPIGKVSSYEEDASGDTYNIEVALFNDMTNLSNVYIINNLDKQEIQSLESSKND